MLTCGKLTGCSDSVWLLNTLSLTTDELVILVLLGIVASILILALLCLVIKYLEVFIVRSSFLLGSICLSRSRHWILKFTLAIGGAVL